MILLKPFGFDASSIYMWKKWDVFPCFSETLFRKENLEHDNIQNMIFAIFDLLILKNDYLLYLVRVLIFFGINAGEKFRKLKYINKWMNKDSAL